MVQLGGYNVYKGAPFQRGYGIGGTFRKFFNWIVPLVMPSVKAGLKQVGNTALTAVSDIAKDVASGRRVKEAATERINTAVDQIKENVESKFRGAGIKRKRKPKKQIIIIKRKKSKKQSQDIFS